MSKIKKQIIILQLMTLIIGGCGCEMKKEKIKQEPTLNEWQKDFLEEQGLPTEYSELNLTQQLSVDAIYEMIMYLEEKYGIGFEYTGYVRPQILEKEYMTAIPEGGNAKTDTVTVTREDDGTFTDDYPNIAVRPYYEQMVTDYVKDYFNSDKIMVSASVSRSTLECINKDSKNVQIYDVGASTVIFIDNNICSESQINDFAKILGQWLQENKLCGVTQLILLNKNVEVNNITQDNFRDFLSTEKYSERINISIQGNQEINIY